jgi:hypothetical protein
VKYIDIDVAANTRHKCDNCHWTGGEADLMPIKDPSERLTPGGVVPSGECPKCGALAYQIEKKRKTKQEKYVDCKGHICPYCGSKDIEAGPVCGEALENGEFTQIVDCKNCKKRWLDIYKLTGFKGI